MRLRRSLILAMLGALMATGLASAQSPGQWLTPFNHKVPDHWQIGKPGWDGEPMSPHIPVSDEDPHRFMAGHMSLIPKGPHRGKVVVWNFMRVLIINQYWSIVDPVAQTYENFELPIDNSVGDLFCSGHAWTKDGDLLVAGGNRFAGGQLVASDIVHRFDPTLATGNTMWVPEPPLAVPRWYPTVVTQGTDSSGRDQLLVFGGLLDPAPAQALFTYEAFDPTGPPGAGIWDPTGPVFNGPVVPCPDTFWFYPRKHLLPSGKVFSAGMPELGYRVLHDTTVAPPAWEVQASNPMFWRLYASTVLFPNEGGSSSVFKDIVVRFAGALVSWDYNTCFPNQWPGLPQSPIPTNTMEFVFADLPASDPNWAWQLANPMENARARPDATLLPDATVLVHGGKLDTASEFSTAQPVLEAELFNETLGSWRTVATAAIRRGYHSTAALLPDGRVLVGGGEGRERDYEIYEPPYLTNGTARPVILNPPPTLSMAYGRSYTLEYRLPPELKVAKAVLMAPASITHHSDMHQRYVELDVCTGGPCPAGSVTFTAPPNSGHAPRGYYMLFLVSNPQNGNPKGTPSVATWVHLL